MIRFARVPVGSGGPVSCRECGGEAEPASYAPAADVVSQVREVAEAWSGGTGPNVMLAGPEPFEHPALPDIVNGSIEAGIARLGAETDGAALGNPRNASGAIAAGVRHVRLVLLGSPGLHDSLTGTPGACEAAQAGARTFVGAAAVHGANVSVTARVPVCPHNIEEVPAAVGVAAGSGCGAVMVSVGPEVDLAVAAPWLTAACDTGVVNAVWVELEGVPFCMLPGHEMHAACLVRPADGAKVDACAGCALDGVCAGGPEGAGPPTLTALRPPADAQDLAGRMAELGRRVGW